MDGLFAPNLEDVISSVMSRRSGEGKGEKCKTKRKLGTNICCLEDDESADGEKIIILATPSGKGKQQENSQPKRGGKEEQEENVPEPRRISLGGEDANNAGSPQCRTPLAEIPQGFENGGCLSAMCSTRRKAQVLESPEVSPLEQQSLPREEVPCVSSSDSGEFVEVPPVAEEAPVEELMGENSAVHSPLPESNTVGVESSMRNLRNALSASDGIKMIHQGLVTLKEEIGYHPTDFFMDVMRVGAQFAPLPEHLLASDQITEEFIINVLSISIESIYDVVGTAQNSECDASLPAVPSEKRESGVSSDTNTDSYATAVEEQPEEITAEEEEKMDSEKENANEDYIKDCLDEAKLEPQECTSEQIEEGNQGVASVDMDEIPDRSCNGVDEDQRDDVLHMEHSEAAEEPVVTDDDLKMCEKEATMNFSHLNLLTNVTIRPRNSIAVCPIDSESESDMDLQDEDDRYDDAEVVETPTNVEVEVEPRDEFQLPAWSEAVASEMAERGEDDIELTDPADIPTIALVDAEAKGGGGRKLKQTECRPSEIHSPNSKPVNRAHYCAPADDKILIVDHDSIGTENVSPRVRQKENEDEEDAWSSDSDMSESMDIANSPQTNMKTLKSQDQIENGTNGASPCTVGCSSAMMSDMSCSSDNSCIITKSTKKAVTKKLVLLSDSEDEVLDQESYVEYPPLHNDLCGGDDDESNSILTWTNDEENKSKPGNERSSAALKSFQKSKAYLTRQLYSEYNRTIFDNQLPLDLEIKWNPSLSTTAGVTHFSRKVVGSSGASSNVSYLCHIELASKVIDSTSRLRQTLCHELCHAAAWLINHVSRPPHGKVFKHWASKAMQVYPDLNVTTCHTYDIHYRFKWKCSNSWCGRVYGRHSNSIDVARQACGICSGKLEFLGKFNADGTPAKSRAPSQFSLFVKKHYKEAKEACGGKSAQQCDVMKHLSEMWHERKEAAGKGKKSTKDEASVKSLIAQFEKFEPK